MALGSEPWTGANQIQIAFATVLDATAGSEPEGLSMRVLREVRGVFQRLYRTHRNRGSDERRDRHKTYVENINSLLQ